MGNAQRLDDDVLSLAELLITIDGLYRQLKTAPKDQRPKLEAQIRELAQAVWAVTDG